MGRYGVCGVAWVVAALVSASPAQAYRTAGETLGDPRARWHDPIVVHLASGTVAASGLDRYGLQRALVGAAATWNGVICANVQVMVGDAESGAPGPGDGVNSVAFVSSGWAAFGPPSAAATTDVRYLTSSDGVRLVEADIYLNAEHFRWSFGDRGVEGRDVQAVVSHEIGHVLGLEHPCEQMGAFGVRHCDASDQASALYPDYLGESQRALGDDDVAGLCFLYPAAEGYCATSADCGAGLSCSAGRCTSRGACPSGECTEGAEAGDLCATRRDCHHEHVCSDEGTCAPSCARAACPAGWHCEADLCVPDAAPYAGPCRFGRDCASGLCLTVDGVGRCSRPCRTGCPAPDLCAEVEGRGLCVPPAPSGGCAAAPGPARRTPIAIFVGIAFLVVRLRPRSQRS